MSADGGVTPAELRRALEAVPPARPDDPASLRAHATVDGQALLDLEAGRADLERQLRAVRGEPAEPPAPGPEPIGGGGPLHRLALAAPPPLRPAVEGLRRALAPAVRLLRRLRSATERPAPPPTPADDQPAAAPPAQDAPEPPVVEPPAITVASGPLVTVVLPTFNRQDILRRVLEAWEAQSPADLPFEIIAVDDGSTDGTPEILAGFASERFGLTVLSQLNQGPAAARNHALAHARGPLVLFTGDDIEPHPRLLAEHLAEHARHRDPRLAVLGHIAWAQEPTPTATMRRVDGPGAEQFSYHWFSDGAEYDFRHFYTSNVSARRDLLALEPDGFSTEFPAAAFEDAEYAYRLSRHGLRIVYHAAARALHHHRYDAPSFFRRQLRCGEMAWQLYRHHPELKKWTSLDELQWRRIEVACGSSLRRTVLSGVAAALDELEAGALAAAAFYDERDLALADDLLGPLFRYGYLRGLAQAAFAGPPSGHVAADTFTRTVVPALETVRNRARSERLPFPRAEIDAVLERFGHLNRTAIS